MTVLITGACGFLGSHVAARLATDRPVVLTDTALVTPMTATDGIPRIWLDVTDQAAVARALNDHHVRDIVHLAALLTDEAATEPTRAACVNVLGTAAVFEAAIAAGIRRVVFASSMAVFGDGTLPAGDDHPVSPRSVYGATKASAEHLATALRADGRSTQLIGLRFGWVYGAGRRHGWNALYELIEAFAFGAPSVRYPAYEVDLDWTYVTDAADAVAAALDAAEPQKVVYNVPGDQRPIGDAVTHLERRWPPTTAIGYPATPPPSGWGMQADGIGIELGWRRRVDLEAGLDLTIAALRAARSNDDNNRRMQ